MDHNFAVQNQVALRYVLGDLTEVERDEFEEHFYSCSICAQEVGEVADGVEAARKTLQRETSQVPAFGRGKPTWFKVLVSRVRAIFCRF